MLIHVNDAVTLQGARTLRHPFIIPYGIHSEYELQIVTGHDNRPVDIESRGCVKWTLTVTPSPENPSTVLAYAVFADNIATGNSLRFDFAATSVEMYKHVAGNPATPAVLQLQGFTDDASPATTVITLPVALVTTAQQRLPVDLSTALMQELQLAVSTVGAAQRSISKYAGDSTGAADRAEQAAANARASEENAAASAEAAGVSADSAADSALTAESYAVGGTGTRPGEDADNARFYNQAAAQDAASADASAQAASDDATLSRSWAVGGTGTRDGEDTNNAKYWADVARGSHDQDKADKVAGAVEGHLAGLDATGNLTDSGIPGGDVARRNGYYGDMTVGRAENLIDLRASSMPRSFGFETAAGKASISEEGPASVTLLKGRTYIQNQLIGATGQSRKAGHGMVTDGSAVAGGVEGACIHGRSLVKNQIVPAYMDKPGTMLTGSLSITDAVPGDAESLLVKGRAVVRNQMVPPSSMSASFYNHGSSYYTHTATWVTGNRMVDGHRYLVTATVTGRFTSADRLEMYTQIVGASPAMFGTPMTATDLYPDTPTFVAWRILDREAYAGRSVYLGVSNPDRTTPIPSTDTFSYTNLHLIDLTQYFNGDDDLAKSFKNWDEYVAYDPWFAEVPNLQNPGELDVYTTPAVSFSGGNSVTAAAPRQMTGVSSTVCDTYDAVSGASVQRTSSADLSSLAWTHTSSGDYGYWTASVSSLGIKAPGSSEAPSMVLSGGMTPVAYSSLDGSSSSVGKVAVSGGSLVINNGSTTAAPTGTIVYELADYVTTTTTPVTIILQSGANTLAQTDSGRRSETALPYKGTDISLPLRSGRTYICKIGNAVSIVTDGSTQSVTGGQDMIVDLTMLYNGVSSLITPIVDWNALVADTGMYGSYTAYDDGTVVHSDQTEVKVTGKNLLDDSIKGRNTTYMFIGSRDQTGGVLLPAGTYHYKVYYEGGTLPSGRTSYVSINGAASYVNKTFTLTKPSYCHCRIYPAPASADFPKYTAQIELSSADTAYEPYFDGGTATAGLLKGIPGSVYDQLDAVTGNVTTRIGSYTFTGNENWTGADGLFQLSGVITDACRLDAGATPVLPYMMAGYTAVQTLTGSSADRTFLLNSAAQTQDVNVLQVKDSSCSTTSEIAAKLAGKSVYYRLASYTSSDTTPQPLLQPAGDVFVMQAAGTLPVDLEVLLEVSEWDEPLYRNCKYLFRENGVDSIVTGSTTVPSKHVVGGRDKLINLTHWFGRGYEPSLQDFYELFPTWRYADIPRNEGAFLNYKGTGVRAVGFNAYNHATGKAVLLGGNQWQICGEYASCSYTDQWGRTEELSIDDKGIFTPVNNGTLTVVGGNGTDTCVHLTWGGYNNYGEPDYKWSPFTVDEAHWNISQLFPHGMNGRGGVCDELASGSARFRWGVKEFDGTEDWSAYGSDGFRVAVPDMMQGGEFGQDGMCNSAVTWTGSPDGTDAPCVLLGQGDSVAYFVHVNKGGALTVDKWRDLLESMNLSGSPLTLVYPLAEPATVEASPEGDFSYMVNDFGTEQSLPVNTVELLTVDLEADIRYSIDFTRMVINLGDDMDRLEADMADLRQQAEAEGPLVLSAAPTQDTESALGGLALWHDTDSGIDRMYHLARITVSGGSKTYHWEECLTDSQLGVPGGMATLGADGKVDEGQLPEIPDSLADLQSDSTHRTVTDAEKASWDAKSDFSGAYDDLTGKPTIPTQLSQLSSDSTHRTVTDTEKTTWNNKSDFSGSYDDLADKPTIPTQLSQLSSDSTHRTVTDSEKTSWNSKSDFSGSYDDLTDKPTIPTQLSQLSSDSTHRTVTDAEKTAWNDKGASLLLSMDPSTYVLTVELRNSAGSTIDTKTVDLPLESMVVSATCSGGVLTLTLQSGDTVDVDVSSLVAGLIPSTEKGAANGVATLDNDGKVPAAQLPAIPAAQVQADWNEADSSAVDFIKNKPTVPTALSQLSSDSTHRTVTDTEKTTWNNKSDFSGSYNDLTDKPTIPSTAADVGAIPTTEKGANNGVATLGNDGKVTPAQLPAAGPAVLTGSADPTTSVVGELGQRYVNTATGKVFGCVNILNSGTEQEPQLVYRWDKDHVGDNVEIGNTLLVGNASSYTKNNYTYEVIGLGNSLTQSGAHHSVAVGYSISQSSDMLFAMGYQITQNASPGVAIAVGNGIQQLTAGSYNFALGSNIAQTMADYAMAVGDNITQYTTGYSLAVGDHITHQYSGTGMAVGSYLTIYHAPDGVAYFGKYNATAANAMRVTGYGTSDNARKNIEELSTGGDLYITGGYQQGVTEIPAATAAYTLAEGVYRHAPSASPTYTLPDVTDTTRTHRIELIVDFTTVQTLAFVDSSNTTVPGMYSPAISAGDVYAFEMEYNATLGRWTILPKLQGTTPCVPPPFEWYTHPQSSRKGSSGQLCLNTSDDRTYLCLDVKSGTEQNPTITRTWRCVPSGSGGILTQYLAITNDAGYYTKTNNTARVLGIGSQVNQSDTSDSLAIGSVTQTNASKSIIAGSSSIQRTYCDCSISVGARITQENVSASAAFGTNINQHNASDCIVAGVANDQGTDVGVIEGSIEVGIGLKNDTLHGTAYFGMFNAPAPDAVRVTGRGSSNTDRKNIEELSEAGDLYITGGYRQGITVIPAATSAYTLKEGVFTHAPAASPTYTLPAVTDTARTHRIELTVDFTTVQTYAFADSTGAAITPVVSPAVSAGDVYTFKMEYSSVLGAWIIAAEAQGAATYVPMSEKGAASGVAELDANAKVPVANLPLATSNTVGAVSASSSGGIQVSSSGGLSLVAATASTIDQRQNLYNPIVPSNLEYAVRSILPGVVEIPESTSSYNLYDASVSTNNHAMGYYHHPLSTPEYVLPLYLNEYEIHDIVLTIYFSSPVLSYSFLDQYDSPITPLSTPTIVDGSVICFLCRYEMAMQTWVIMPVEMGVGFIL